jgi:hypothetical protein
VTMAYSKHRFEIDQWSKVKVAKNGNRQFDLVEIDRKGEHHRVTLYGVPEDKIEQARVNLLDRLLTDRKQRQKYPVAQWVQCVTHGQTRRGYDDWVQSQSNDIDDILGGLA